MLEVSDSLILAMQERFYPITKAIYDLTGRIGSFVNLVFLLGSLRDGLGATKSDIPISLARIGGTALGSAQRIRLGFLPGTSSNHLGLRFFLAGREQDPGVVRSIRRIAFCHPLPGVPGQVFDSPPAPAGGMGPDGTGAVTPAGPDRSAHAAAFELVAPRPNPGLRAAGRPFPFRFGG